MVNLPVACRRKFFMQAAQLDLRVGERWKQPPSVRGRSRAKGENLVYKLVVSRLQVRAIGVGIYQSEKLGFRQYKEIHSFLF